MLRYLFSSWRAAPSHSNASGSKNNNNNKRISTGSTSSKQQERRPKSIPRTLRKKRPSETAEQLLTMKKTRKMSESGFLDRAFENASFVPEEFDDFDEKPEDAMIPSETSRVW